MGRARQGGCDRGAAGPVVIVEGVGAARRELAPYLAYAVWVDADRQVAMARGMAREGETLAFWREWEVAEERHLGRDRPWERADLVLSNDERADLRADDGLLVVPAATWTRAARPT